MRTFLDRMIYLVHFNSPVLFMLTQSDFAMAKKLALDVDYPNVGEVNSIYGIPIVIVDVRYSAWINKDLLVQPL